MVFKDINDENGWLTVEYAATWKYGFDFMLDAAQVILMDFGSDLQRVATAEIAGGKFTDVTESVMDCGGRIRRCETITECGVLAVAGISGIMECPMQIKFYNQSNTVVLDIPVGQIPDSNPIKDELDDNEHIFDTYMNSVEIKAYCADTERRVRAELEK